MAVRLGRYLVLAQSRDDPSLTDAHPYVLIHAGNKFGTGTHPTTRICVTLLEEILKEGSSVLDLGTGTGILAICAAKLLARHVVAIDHDFDACKIAMDNVINNSLGTIVQVINGRLDALSTRTSFDLALANLELHTLIHVIPHVKDHLKPGGFLVTSGVQRSAQADLLNVLADSGLLTVSSCTEGEWVGFLVSPTTGESPGEIS